MRPILKQWLEANLPEVVRDFNGPATIAQIEEIENHSGVVLPDEFKNLYLEHNGQKDLGNATGLFYGLSFLSLERILDELNNWAELADSGMNEEMPEVGKSHIPDMIKEEYTNKLWIPFAYNWGGNFLGLDFDPGVKGTIGQVVNFGRDEDEKYVLAPSFSEFIDWYIAELKSGNFRIQNNNEGGRSFNTKHPRADHFLDSVRKMFRKNA